MTWHVIDKLPNHAEIKNCYRQLNSCLKWITAWSPLKIQKSKGQIWTLKFTWHQNLIETTGKFEVEIKNQLGQCAKVRKCSFFKLFVWTIITSLSY